MGPDVDQNLLTWIIFLPAATAVALVFIGFISSLLGSSKGLPAVLWRTAGFSSAALNFILCAMALWPRFDPEEIGYQLVERAPWVPEYGIHYFVGVDGISLPLVLLTALLVPLVLLASWNEIVSSERTFVALVLVLETGVLGALLSLNLFQFFFCWEAVSIPMYFLMGIWGGAARVPAAVRFFFQTLLGSVLMFVAMLVLYRLQLEQTGVPTFDLVGVPGSLELGLLGTEIPTLASGAAWWMTQYWIFIAFGLTFAAKVAVFPFHSWLPTVHVELSTPAVVLLVAVLLKLGAYGLLRFALPLCPAVAQSPELLSPILYVTLTGVLFASMLALVQRDMGRLLAYCTIAHLGYAVLGIFTFNVHGLVGSVLELANHGLSTAGLLLLVGFLYERRGTRAVRDFGGIAKPMPVLAACFGIFVMSSLGLPGLNGFVGEFFILLGTFSESPGVGTGMVIALLLTAVYLLWMFRRVMFGEVENPENRGLIDLNWRERAVALGLLIPVVWIGVYPNPLLRRIEPSVMELLRVMDERSGDSLVIDPPDFETTALPKRLREDPG
jgi:NADH-quinone oxidoreductase subunit M